MALHAADKDYTPKNNEQKISTSELCCDGCVPGLEDEVQAVRIDVLNGRADVHAYPNNSHIINYF